MKTKTFNTLFLFYAFGIFILFSACGGGSIRQDSAKSGEKYRDMVTEDVAYEMTEEEADMPDPGIQPAPDGDDDEVKKDSFIQKNMTGYMKTLL